MKKFKEFLKEKKGVPGRDRGKFEYFDNRDLKKMEYYADEDDEIWYVYDTEKGFNWTGGVATEEEAEKQVKELEKSLKDYLKRENIK